MMKSFVVRPVQSTICYCHFCSSFIRFQFHRTGELVNCSACGMETILFIPGRAAPYSDAAVSLEVKDVIWQAKGALGIRKLVGRVVNPSPKELDWVRIEFILFNDLGEPVGSTSDCQITFPAMHQWEFQSPVCQKDAVRVSVPLLSCEYGRITCSGGKRRQDN